MPSENVSRFCSIFYLLFLYSLRSELCIYEIVRIRLFAYAFDLYSNVYVFLFILFIIVAGTFCSAA